MPTIDDFEKTISGKVIYKNYIIEYDPPPIPMRQFDWRFTHEDYDGPEDGRTYSAASFEDCIEEIDNLTESN